MICIRRAVNINCTRLPDLPLVEPLGYHDFLKLMSCARLVLTDSGGIQEETTVLKVPCLTLRKNTERSATVFYGSNKVVGIEPKTILLVYQQIKSGCPKDYRILPLWDGHAAERIVETVALRFSGTGKKRKRSCVQYCNDESNMEYSKHEY